MVLYASANQQQHPYAANHHPYQISQHDLLLRQSSETSISSFGVTPGLKPCTKQYSSTSLELSQHSRSLHGTSSHHAPTKSVRFNMYRNEYSTDVDMCQEDRRKKLWYSSPEIGALRKTNKALLHKMHEAVQKAQKKAQKDGSREEPHPYLAAYRALSQVQTTKEINKLLHVTVDAATAEKVGLVHFGLEKWCKTLVHDKTSRRRQMYRLVDDPATLADDEALRVACRSISQPSRLFAHYIALQVEKQVR